MTTTTRTWTIEMLWQCSHCKVINPGMSGNERESLKCKNCGAEKTNEPWIMPDSPEHAKALTGERDRKARLGPNWACKFCNAESRADRKTCEVCGATRAETPRPPVPAVRRTPDPPAPPDPPGNPLGLIVPPAPPAHVPLGPPRQEPEPSVLVDPVASRPTVPPAKAWEAVKGYREAPFVEPPPPDELPDVLTRYEPWDYIKWILAFVCAGLFVWFLVWLFSPNEATARVARMTWSRERRLEERHSYAGEGWRRQAPPLVYSWDACETRQSGTENCHPHDCNCHTVYEDCNCTGGGTYRCNPHTVRGPCTSNRNGSATCSERTEYDDCPRPRVCARCPKRVCTTCYDQCPVYEEWCSYHYHQWDQIGQQRTGGEGRECAWPALDAHGPLQRIQADERYTVRFDDTASPRTWTRNYGYARYELFEVGQRWKVEWTRAGGFTLMGRAL